MTTVNRLLQFVDALRRQGVRASAREVLDLFAALSTLEAAAFANQAMLYAVCATTLAKSDAEEQIVARVFPLFFSAGDTAPAFRLGAALVQRGVSDDQVRALMQLRAEQQGVDQLLDALLAQDAGAIAALIEDALEDADLGGMQTTLQIPYFTARVLERLNAQAMLARLADLLAGRRGASAAQRPALIDDAASAGGTFTAGITAGIVDGVVHDVAEYLRRQVRASVARVQRRTGRSTAAANDDLRRDLLTLSPNERDALRREVERLASRLKRRLALRRKRARRGSVDVRRTARRSAATDGLLLAVEQRRRRRKRPSLVMLCDVSDSVRAASVFMLELVAALGAAFSSVRAFVFVDRAVEVTALFRNAPRAATEAILDGRTVHLGANSDYGGALRSFLLATQGTLNRNTTVMILGDGRSNYRPPEEWVLSAIRQRCRRLLWLCPEEQATWGFGDSEMRRYARHADGIFAVRSLRDLAHAIDRMPRG